MWNDKQQQVFKNNKSAVAKPIMVTSPDVTKPIILYTDASDNIIGGLLTQDDKTISCFSKKLTLTQQNYTKRDNE